MKVLFVASEHTGLAFSAQDFFRREYVKALKKKAQVVTIYFNIHKDYHLFYQERFDYIFSPDTVFDAFTPEAKLLELASALKSQVDEVLESFKPDIIHCNDNFSFLPFRFCKNVFYSAHFSSRVWAQSSLLNPLYFNEKKFETCAIENSSLCAVYSDFANNFALNLTSQMSSPVVLPFGGSESFNSFDICKRKNRKDGRLNVSFFGDFDIVKEGLHEFIYAINILGRKFRDKHDVYYSLYGKGKIDINLDVSLIDEIKNLEEEDFYYAFCDCDIVVIPEQYEAFCLKALKAMASGSLLLIPSGLGSEMFTKPGYNCIEIPKNGYEMSKVVRDSIIDYDKLALIQDNARRTALEWTWERSVNAHMYFYNMILNKRKSHVVNGYGKDFRKLCYLYKESNDVEKIHQAERERVAVSYALQNFSRKGQDGKILVLTGNFNPDKDFYSENVVVIPVVEESSEGITVRPECLPFDNNFFDYVIVAGAWECVLDPVGALMEIERVCKNSVLMLFNSGLPLAWQTLKREHYNSWKEINQSGWNLENQFLNKKDKILDSINYSHSFIVKDASNITEAFA